jgi:hypothetical protein
MGKTQLSETDVADLLREVDALMSQLALAAEQDRSQGSGLRPRPQSLSRFFPPLRLALAPALA